MEEALTPAVGDLRAFEGESRPSLRRLRASRRRSDLEGFLGELKRLGLARLHHGAQLLCKRLWARQGRVLAQLAQLVLLGLDLPLQSGLLLLELRYLVVEGIVVGSVGLEGDSDMLRELKSLLTRFAVVFRLFACV